MHAIQGTTFILKATPNHLHIFPSQITIPSMTPNTQAARLLGNKLGGELVVAAKEAHKLGSVLILGDRLFGVTIQRAFDRLSLYEKCKVGFMMIWEILTMR